MSHAETQPIQPRGERRITSDAAGAHWRRWLMLAVLILANVVAWRSTLEGRFVFDDVVILVEGEKRLAEPWPLSRSLRFEQRPLTWITFALNHAAGGLEPRGYRLVNLVLHLAAAVLLFAAVREGVRHRPRQSEPTNPEHDSRRADWIALATALLWSLHPLATSAAGYVVQRAEVLVAVWTMAAAYALLRSLRSSTPAAWLAAMSTSVVLAILSKPTAVFLPPLLLVIDWCLSQDRLGSIAARRGWAHGVNFAAVLLLVPLGVIGGLAATDAGPTGAGMGVAGTSPLDYALVQIRAIGLYIELCWWPVGLSIDHGASALAPTRLAWIGGAALLVATFASLAGLVGRRWWGVIPAMLLLSLAPSSSVVPVADPVAEHRMYLPLIAVTLAVSCGMAALVSALGRGSPARGRVAAVSAIAALAAVATAEGIRTHRRCGDYAQPAALWSEVLDRRPDDLRALLNRSQALIEAGDPEAAEADLERVQRLAPGDPRVLLNRAILEIESGDAESALPRIELAIAAFPRLAAGHAARGDALRMLGRPLEAIESYRRAERWRPTEPLLPLSRGNALAELGSLDEAAAAFALAAKLADAAGEPSVAASGWFNLGNMHFIAERYLESVAAYDEALAREPDHAEAQHWRAEASALAEGASP